MLYVEDVLPQTERQTQRPLAGQSVSVGRATLIMINIVFVRAVAVLLTFNLSRVWRRRQRTHRNTRVHAEHTHTHARDSRSDGSPSPSEKCRGYNFARLAHADLRCERTSACQFRLYQRECQNESKSLFREWCCNVPMSYYMHAKRMSTARLDSRR